MNGNVIIRKNTPEEFDKLIKMLDEAFGFPSERTDGFVSLLPKLYRADACDNIVAVRDGEILGAVGLYPRKISVCGRELTSVGIGNVACRADMRGTGIMSQLMERAAEEIRDSGADLSDLGGRRHRYGHFGYECAGRVYHFRVRSDAKRHLGAEIMSDTLACEPLDGYMSESEALHNKKRSRFIRDGFADVIASWEADAIAFTENGRFVGYALLDRGRVTETALYDSEKFGAAVGALLEFTKEEELTFVMHETDPLIGKIHAFYDGVNVRTNEQISVMHHRCVAETYLRYAAELHDLPDGELPLLIHGVCGDESFTLRVADGVVSVTDTAETPIELSHNDAIALLYGLVSPHRATLLHAVASWLPLPIYIPSPDCV